MKSKNIRLAMFVVLILIISALFAGCLEDPVWMPKSDTATPTEMPATAVSTLEVTATPALTATAIIPYTPTPSPTPTAEPSPPSTPAATPAPTPTSAPPTPPDILGLPPEDLGAANYTEASDQIAYISANLGSDLPLVQEYCAYITGKSMSMDGQTDIIFDYVEWLSDPEATVAYLEDHPGADASDYEFIEQIGYIRNVDPTTVVLHTSPDTRYFLNRPLMTSQVGEVDYDEFRDWLFPLAHDAFVVVCEVDGVIARVEWIFMP